MKDCCACKTGLLWTLRSSYHRPTTKQGVVTHWPQGYHSSGVHPSVNYVSTTLLNMGTTWSIERSFRPGHERITFANLSSEFGCASVTNLPDLVVSWESLDFFSKCLFMYRCIIPFYHMSTSIITWNVPCSQWNWCSISYTPGTYDNWVVCHIRLPNYLTISAHHTSFGEVAVGGVISWLSKNILYDICYRIAGAILWAECS